MRVLLITLLVLVDIAYFDHVLHYYQKQTSEGGESYTSEGYVDMIQITRYNSKSAHVSPVASWMQKVHEDDYWEVETLKQNNVIIAYQEIMRKLKQNQTTSSHTLQETYGCVMKDDGTTSGFWHYGYDGKDFITLDTKRWVYQNLTEQAYVIAQQWNQPKAKELAQAKEYLETECVNWLKKYLEYGKVELERKVRPEVKLFGRRSGDDVRLHCEVYGFYPRDVDVTWKRNRDDIPTDEAKQILPEKSTYQVRISLLVTPEAQTQYSCHVDHSSLDEPLSIMWDSHFQEVDAHTATVTISIGSAVGAIVVVLVVGGIVWKKKQERSRPECNRYEGVFTSCVDQETS